MEGKEKKSNHRLSASFKTGAIALAFLIIGYQVALFVHSAAVTRLVSHRDAPDTVFVVDEALARKVLAGDGAETAPTGTAGKSQETGNGQNRVDSKSRNSHKSTGTASGPTGSREANVIVRHDSPHSPAANRIMEKAGARRIESFAFDPNTVSISDLQRLGFTEKQALAIDNYRRKGGRFRRPSDFAKSYVVADSVFARLEPFIRIPRIDINSADSTAFDTLPGIGAYYASRMVSYRNDLGGYSYPEQLMDIYHFDQAKFDALKDLITVGPSEPYPLWILPEEELTHHPYLDRHSAHAIVLFRDNNPKSLWSVESLTRAGILPADAASKLSRCRIAAP